MCLYNHARRLRLEKLSYLELSRSSSGFLKPLLDPGCGFKSETDKKLTAMGLTGIPIPQRTQVSVRVTAMQRPWPLVKAKASGFVLVSECLPGIISASSKVVKCTKG
jgi:hypothetical protein